MKEFFHNLVSTGWGIAILSVLAVLIWFVLSIVLYKQFFKRFYDILLSGIALVVFSPVFAILAVLVAVKLGRPVIFHQTRPGKKDKIFKLHKFRSMTNARGENGELLPDEQRMTAFGRKLRSSSLDELPEIWDIFRGKMSIIGPRPQLVKDLVFMDENVRRRHKVRPGLTGLAQVNGRNNIEWDERFRYDLEYVEHLSFFNDMKIFFKTIGKVFARADVSTEGMETSEDYGDWLLRRGEVTEEEYTAFLAEAKNIVAKK